MPVDRDESLRRRRLAAQRLAPETAAASVEDAARAVLGIQAQDLRAAGLAIRARVPGAAASDLVGADLVRTWTVRGTAHLLAADDLPLFDALTGPRNRRRFDALMRKRSNLEIAEKIRPAAIELIADGPLTRAELLQRLDERGMPSLGPHSVNVLMPWLASTGEVIGSADGSFRLAEPPPAIGADEALATLGHRYLAGYGPAGPEDLARWSGLPITTCRRALADVPGTEDAGAGMLALAGAPAPEPPRVRMLGAFDTSLLGWRDRDLLVPPAEAHRLLPGGGVVRAVVLASGRAAGTWKVEGSGARRRVTFDWFADPPPADALASEIAAVGEWLGLELEPAS